MTRFSPFFLLGLLLCRPADAFDWTATSVGLSHSNHYAEPFNNKDVGKNIYSRTHANGYRYGSNFLNIDHLVSDSSDPAPSGSGARETYVVYRHLLDLSKLIGQPLRFGPIRSVGLTAGFDWNNKNDVGYASKKQMLVIGPTLMLDVPGFLNISLLVLEESNRPRSIADRYTYKTHPMLNLAWNIPLGNLGTLPVEFAGYANFIAAKGTNEFGSQTARETNIDMKLMVDAGRLAGRGSSPFKIGIGYQYWHNKFGNLPSTVGSTARTPYLRAEYHF